LKLIDVDYKATLEDFLRKCNEQISGSKNEIALRPSKANQVIYGVNSSIDDDVKYAKEYVEDGEVPLIYELNTDWSSKDRKVVGSALTETENWDLVVDCTIQDCRKMLDAGVHLSDRIPVH
jgi:hypothetical protein